MTSAARSTNSFQTNDACKHEIMVIISHRLSQTYICQVVSPDVVKEMDVENYIRLCGVSQFSKHPEISKRSRASFGWTKYYDDSPAFINTDTWVQMAEVKSFLNIVGLAGCF